MDPASDRHNHEDRATSNIAEFDDRFKKKKGKGHDLSYGQSSPIPDLPYPAAAVTTGTYSSRPRTQTDATSVTSSTSFSRKSQSSSHSRGRKRTPSYRPQGARRKSRQYPSGAFGAQRSRSASQAPPQTQQEEEDKNNDSNKNKNKNTPSSPPRFQSLRTLSTQAAAAVVSIYNALSVWLDFPTISLQIRRAYTRCISGLELYLLFIAAIGALRLLQYLSNGNTLLVVAVPTVLVAAGQMPSLESSGLSQALLALAGGIPGIAAVTGGAAANGDAAGGNQQAVDPG